MTDGTASEAARWAGSPYNASDEGLHKPTADPDHNESVYFNFASALRDGPMGGIVRVGLRPGNEYAETTVHLPLADGSTIFLYARGDYGYEQHEVGTVRYEAEGLRIENVEPGARWRLSYEGSAPRRITDMAAFAETPGDVWRASPQVPCRVELDWSATHPVHVLTESGSLLGNELGSEIAADHYEQFGRVVGRVEVEGEGWDVSCDSFRDHSWGVRRWDSAPNQDFLTAHFHDGRCLVASLTRTDGPDDVSGVAWAPSGDGPSALERFVGVSEYEGQPTLSPRFTMTIDVDGKDVDVAAEVAAATPLRVGKTVRMFQVLLRLDGELGPGLGWIDLARTRPGA